MTTDQPIRLIILARDQSAKVQNAWQELKSFLEAQSKTEIVAAAVTEDLVLDGLDADLVVTLGGDGAILRACRQLAENQLPLMGVNLGRLGFLAELRLEQFMENFPLIQKQAYQIIDHLMFECEHCHADGSSETYLGLNEVLISSTLSSRMLDIDLSIDDEQVTTYSCDGLIVSSPVGSTAHSLSAGGPILKQDLKAFVITPICPHTLTNRPLVDRADCVYRLSMPRVPEGATVVVDGQLRRPFQEGDSVFIRKASVTFKLARIPGHSFYATINKKLGWGGQLRYRKT